MSQVILILSDALRYDAAVQGMGFLGHLVETRQATLYKVIGEVISQLVIAHTICALLGTPISKTMRLSGNYRGGVAMPPVPVTPTEPTMMLPSII